MIKILQKTVILAVLVLFVQCSKLGYVDRRYTKGHYKPHNKTLTVKSKPSKSIDLPEVETKTDISLEKKDPVEPIVKEDVIASTKKALPAQPVKTKKRILPGLDKKNVAAKKAKVLSKLPFSSVLIKKQPKTETKSDDGGNIATMLLSILGFIAAIVAFILVFVGIIDSILIVAVSPFLFIAIILGIAALVCGILTLVLGGRDLEGYQRSFAILSIVFGTIAIVLGAVWAYLIAAILYA